MSKPPLSVRRSDLELDDLQTRAALERGYAGRLATIGPDGWPYVVPLMYVVKEQDIYVHNSRAPGHLRTNIDHDNHVCFVVDEPGDVFAYGRFECDSAVSYSSVMAFGRIRVILSDEEKTSFCDDLMAKYSTNQPDRPKGFYPRLDQITIYAIRIERLTGKEIKLPPTSAQWPALDRTKSPHATPPEND